MTEMVNQRCSDIEFKQVFIIVVLSRINR